MLTCDSSSAWIPHLSEQSLQLVQALVTAVRPPKVHSFAGGLMDQHQKTGANHWFDLFFAGNVQVRLPAEDDIIMFGRAKRSSTMLEDF